MSGPVVVANPASAAAGGEELLYTDVERTRARCAELLAELRPLLDEPSATAEQTLRTAVAELQRLGPEHACPELVECLLSIAHYCYLQRQASLGIEPTSRAVDLARLLSRPELLRIALTSLGALQTECGDTHGALEACLEALSIAREIGDADQEAPVWNNLGVALQSVGQHVEAIRCLEKALTIAEVSDRWRTVVSQALSNIAGCALHLSEDNKGISAVRGAIDRNAQPGNVNQCLSRTIAESHYARLLLEAGEVADAERHAELARTYAIKSGSAKADYVASMTSGLIEVHSSRVDIGLTRLKRTLEHARNEMKSDVRDALSACVAGYEVAGQPDAALVYLHELMALNREGRAARLLAPFKALAAEIGSDDAPDQRHDHLLTGKALDLAGRIDKCITALVTAAIDNALRAGHDATRIFRVGRLAQLFALSLGWKEETAAELALAVRLMDVGAIVVPDALLSKPRGLSAGERKLVAEHTGYGADLLRQARLALLQPCVPTSKFHHECWNGTGPWGLAREAIPIEARIAALADTLDALTHARPWRGAKSLPAALRMISEQAGAQFDPALAERFVDFLRQEYWRHDEWEAHLSADAHDNAYIRSRERLVSFLREAPERK
jgi:HD-GYP domain-containing protein (c-di-GMP phosphodiesterase class II)